MIVFGLALLLWYAAAKAIQHAGRKVEAWQPETWFTDEDPE